MELNIMQENMTTQPMTTTAAQLMIEAMNALRERKISAHDAQAIAQLGIGVVQAANAEIQFIRATKAIPEGSGMGQSLCYLSQENGEG